MPAPSAAPPPGVVSLPDGHLVVGPDLEVVGELGRGAHSVVYRVRRHGVEYALKVRASRGEDQDLVVFRREAALLACLDHPGLPRIFEVGEVGGRPYLVLELIDGQALADRLLDGPLDEPLLRRLASDVAGALTTAHRSGLVHRDVKPANILVEPGGTARLIDFGLATRETGASGDDAAVAGTLAYSAPEQTGMLKRPVDGRSDLYGLGVVLFECATGQPPFHAADVGELIRLHATATPPDPRTLRPQLSPGLAAIIGKLLAKDPDDRYQSGAGLLADLDLIAGAPDGDLVVGTRDAPAGTHADQRLVGRGREHGQLASRWRRALAGHGGVALVQGPPGAGKSRLVRELATAVRADDRPVLYGKCVPDDPVPLAPIRAAVDGYLQGVTRAAASERTAAYGRLRQAAGEAAALLRPLSPALAEVLPVAGLAGDDRHDQFASAVAGFLVELARLEGGALLHVDDVQWLDDASRRVLAQLGRALPEAPLLLVATARDDDESVAAVDGFLRELGGLVDPELTLAPLDDDAVTQLVAVQLGGGVIEPDLVTALTRRTGGNPFTIQEYVRAAVDAGHLRPAWGRWLFDADGMDRLELSGDALALIVRRIEGLGGVARQVLVAAAAVGMRFPADLLADVCGLDRGPLLDVLGEAAARRLVEARGTATYAFLHDRIREALLADEDAAVLRRVHQRIAEVLDRAGDEEAGDDTGRAYAVARHYTRGEASSGPYRVYTACAAAGRLALADHAPAEALAFLEQAVAAAHAAGTTPEGTFHEALGIALHRNGRFVEARQSFTRALDGEPDPLRRARIHGLIAQVHLSAWEPDLALDGAARALRELKRPLPPGRFRLALTTMLSFLAGLLVGVTRFGYASATGVDRERYQLLASIYDIGGYAAAMSMRLPLQAAFSFRSLYTINRLGPGVEYVRRMAGFGVTADVARRRHLADRLYARAAAVAAALGDPTLAAHVEWKRAAGAYFGGLDSGETWLRVLEERGRWLDLGDYLTGVATWCAQLSLRGRTREAEAWYQRGRSRLSAGAEAEGSALTAVGIAIPAQAGRPAEAARRLRPVQEFVAANPQNLSQRINATGALMYIALEQGDHGEAFLRPVAVFEALGLRPRQLLGEQRVIYVHLAYGWLARLADPGIADRAAARAGAAKALATLGRAATSPQLRAHHWIGRASLAQLTGDPERAMRCLAEADRLVERVDAPALAYEAARVRARALRALGLGAAADRQASLALLLAVQQDWPHRARWVRAEFGVTEPGGSGRWGGSPDVASGSVTARRLQALQQVSLAAATAIDPREVARVALDETVQILGADRAYLFLCDGDRLLPHLGRDAERHDIDELTGYSSTLVDRVQDSREALVVTGSDEGAALGSQSAVVHGLRSIMIAPVEFDGRLLGVVYLDSRVAKGIFTNEDVDILVAITNHVAVSLETARAVQLEMAVRAADHQRDTAEMLRATMAELSAILDPDEVARRLLETLAGMLPGQVAVLLRQAEQRMVVAAVHGAAAVGTELDPAADPVLAGLRGLTEPRAGVVAPGRPAPAEAVLGDARSWLALPISRPPGVVLVGSRLDHVPPARVEVAATLAGQGMVAYENARLFTQVQRLATTDGLTGLHNRNHFFELAGRQLDVARRYGRAAAAVMIDIDHFKRINDTHGHAVGDEVISTVAARLRSACRTSDVLGRYGGEEFALVTPETAAGVVDLAERLRAVVADTPVPTAAGPLAVTISVGVTHADNGDTDLGKLLDRADAALYDAKMAGRDRVGAR